MTKFLFNCAFFIGALAVLWIGQIFLGADILGLGVTLLIGIVYLIGTWELLKFRRESVALHNALMELPEELSDLQQWLNSLSAGMQNAVRLRINGVRNGLPAPVVTPYLVGLLVMLGLLGTFVGMVDTLNGAVVALEGENELEAIRAGLAAPIEGLGLAFGTSVAGVAASAILGLLSTISRRERANLSYVLDDAVANQLRVFSKSYQEQQAFIAIQDQAKALPKVADQLSQLAETLEGMAKGIGNDLLSSQTKFQQTTTESYQTLHSALEESLKAHLQDNQQHILKTIQPMAQESLAQLNRSSLSTQEQLSKANQQQLDVLSDVFDKTVVQQRESSTAMVSSFEKTIQNVTEQLQQNTQSLLDSIVSSNQSWSQQQAQQASKLSEAVNQQFTQLRDDDIKRTDAAVARLAELETVVTEQLVVLGKGLEAPMTQLIEAASHAPKAASQVITEMRDEMTKNMARDNGLLEERALLAQRLDRLSTTVEQGAQDQQLTINTVLENSTQKLGELSAQFGEQLQSEVAKLSAAADYFSASSVEINSLGDGFEVAVTRFSESSQALIDNLNRMEATLEQSNQRSDEQFSYYIAQAREIIDHNLLSHKQIIDAMAVQPSVKEA